MDLFELVNLAGGLALFLYGMSVMSGALEKVSEGHLEKVLERLTSNVLKAVLLGAAVTAVIQSSSATTVIVVGLVNAGVLRLRQAIGVIMGANIGTTVTAHILRLTSVTGGGVLMRVLRPATLSGVLAVAGILLLLGARQDRAKSLGQMLLGLGVLFTGMLQMEEAVGPLAQLPAFARLFATLQSPLLAVAVGAAVTAIIQSSSASVGILQAVSATGAVTYAAAIPLILGQNIGTCITPILAGIGASRAAKRSAAVHLVFNLLGTTLFLGGLYLARSLVTLPFWDQPINSGGIANFHTLFNVTVTLVLLPFTGLLERLAYLVIPKGGQEQEQSAADLLEERLLVSPGLALDHAREAVYQMALLARDNLGLAAALLLDPEEPDQKRVRLLASNESQVDRYQDRIEEYLLQLSRRHLTHQSKEGVTLLLHMIGEFERIADHAENILEARQRLARSGAVFSPAAREELARMTAAVTEVVDTALEAYRTGNPGVAARIEPLEEVIDHMEDQLKNIHIDRLRDGLCGVDAALAYVEALSSLERVADHCSNVGVQVIHRARGMDRYDTHGYLEALHTGQDGEYARMYREFEDKYRG